MKSGELTEITSNAGETGEKNTSSRYKILLADDDGSFRTLASHALGRFEYDVLTVPDGLEAIKRTTSQHFDAILLDAKMPVIDGFEVCSKLQSKLGDHCPPIIISTGLEDDESVNRAFEVGAADYVHKPVNWTVLAGKLKYLLMPPSSQHQTNLLEKDIHRVISASTGAHLVLDREAVITAVNGVTALPHSATYSFKIGSCLFECVSRDSVSKILDGWQRLLKLGESGPVLLANHDDTNPYVLELNFVEFRANSILCLINDCTGHYLAEQRIFDLAFLDQTTGAGNREHLINWVNQNISALDVMENCAVLRGQIKNYFDHEIRLGRAGLDAIAVHVIDRLNQWCSEQNLQKYLGESTSGFVARLTEDEVAMGLVGNFNVSALEKFAQDLLNDLGRPLDLDANTILLDIELGLADSPHVGRNPAELLNAASLAMKVPNKAFSDQLFCFNESVREQIRLQANMERYLHRDIEQCQLHMAYQPKVDATSLKLVGIEALLRWNCKELGNVSPAVFIPLAEQCGLMSQLSQMVVQLVLDQLVAWRGTATGEIPVAINVSGSHLGTNNFVCDLARELNQRDIEPHLIELEVTESVMIDGQNRAIKNLQQLQEQGIKISVDDFGTGYSSFSYLRSLPVDALKIDRSFVQNIHVDPKALAIAKAIITVGQELSLVVIAEGVETITQLETLRDLGCHIIQGFFTGRPVMPEEVISEAESALFAAAS